MVSNVAPNFHRLFWRESRAVSINLLNPCVLKRTGNVAVSIVDLAVGGCVLVGEFSADGEDDSLQVNPEDEEIQNSTN